MTSPYDTLRTAGPHLSLGIQLVASLLIFLLLGYWADRILGTEPWLLMAGAILGMAAFTARIIQLVRKT